MSPHLVRTAGLADHRRTRDRVRAGRDRRPPVPDPLGRASGRGGRVAGGPSRGRFQAGGAMTRGALGRHGRRCVGSSTRRPDLSAARRRWTLFRVALESPEPPFLLLHLHGPPGIGRAGAPAPTCPRGLRASSDETVVRLDGRDLVPSTAAVLQVLGDALELPPGDDAVSGPPGVGRLVVLFDTYERLASLEGSVRTRLLPQLPARLSVTVFASRERPGPGLACRSGVAASCYGWCRCET